MAGGDRLAGNVVGALTVSALGQHRGADDLDHGNGSLPSLAGPLCRPERVPASARFHLPAGGADQGAEIQVGQVVPPELWHGIERLEMGGTTGSTHHADGRRGILGQLVPLFGRRWVAQVAPAIMWSTAPGPRHGFNRLNLRRLKVSATTAGKVAPLVPLSMPAPGRSGDRWRRLHQQSLRRARAARTIPHSPSSRLISLS